MVHALCAPIAALGFQQVEAHRPRRTEHFTEIGRKRPGKAGGAPAGRDRDGQIAAPDQSGRVEVAQFGHVLDIHQRAYRARAGRDFARPFLVEIGDVDDAIARQIAVRRHARDLRRARLKQQLQSARGARTVPDQGDRQFRGVEIDRQHGRILGFGRKFGN